jgi:polyhydroxybutyrate depolymerase
MKTAFVFLFTIMFPLFCLSQQTISGSIVHDGLQRDYILYIPANYSGSTAVPLILNFHGYGSNATEQMWYGDFRSISDTAGFLVVHPEGTLFNGITHWNVGGWTIGSTVDDVGFTGALIDSLSSVYNIDAARVYATGMSNGGFMSFLLACQLSEKIAAIASVTGSMTPETYNNSNPQHPTPVLQMHGTADGVVPYNGAFYTEPIAEVLQYWVEYNNCNTTPVFTELPDIDPNDGSTVEHYAYNDGFSGVSVEHYKIIGGGHTWPGSAFGGAGTNNDIDASVEIWNFFSKYDINGLIGTTAIHLFGDENVKLNVYPNPAKSYIIIENDIINQVEYELFSTMGERLISGTIASCRQQVDLPDLLPGIYFLKVRERSYKILITR